MASDELRFLRDRVRPSIRTDVVEVAQTRTAQGAGWFGIPRQVFCYIDFLGSIAYDNRKGERDVTSTRKSVRFVKEFFPEPYRACAHLLVAMWRHGTVHGFIPYRYYVLKNGRRFQVEWTTNNDGAAHNRKVNVRFLDVHGSPNSLCLSINTCALADDLLSAFDMFIGRMESDASFARACARRLRRARLPRFVRAKGFRLAGKAEIEAEILGAKTTGILKGDQVTWYEEGSA